MLRFAWLGVAGCGLALLLGCGRKDMAVAGADVKNAGNERAAGVTDWPQWRGPERTGVSRETGLLKSWPKEGPRLVWTFENAGIGFSGPAIVGNRLYILGARGNKELLLAIDVAKGTEAWAAEVGNRYDNGWGDGPRCTPTVDGDAIYAIGGQGDLVCVDTAGKNRWSKSLTRELGGGLPGWGYTESPLVDGDRVICTPGGGQGTFAALDKKTGAVVWRSKGLRDGAAYSSIIVAEVGGVRQYINMTSDGVAAVAAKDGRSLWHSDQSANDTAIIPTPIFADSSVYVTSGYGAGCGLLKLTADGDSTKAERVWSNKKMKNQHGGVILLGQHVYGFSDGNGWVCQEFATGKTAWEEKGKLGKGSLTCAGGMLYCYSENNGTCVLIEASPLGWKEAGRFKIPRETKQPRKSGQIWTHPVVSNGRLYLRDQDLLFCFDVKDAGR